MVKKRKNGADADYLVVYVCSCLKKLGKYVRVQRRRIIFYVISRYFLEGAIMEFWGFEAILFVL